MRLVEGVALVAIQLVSAPPDLVSRKVKGSSAPQSPPASANPHTKACDADSSKVLVQARMGPVVAWLTGRGVGVPAPGLGGNQVAAGRKRAAMQMAIKGCREARHSSKSWSCILLPLGSSR